MLTPKERTCPGFPGRMATLCKDKMGKGGTRNATLSSLQEMWGVNAVMMGMRKPESIWVL